MPEPGVQRIALLDAPAVLGWERWRDIEARCTIGLMEDRLAGAMAAGRIPPQATRPWPSSSSAPGTSSGRTQA